MALMGDSGAEIGSGGRSRIEGRDRDRVGRRMKKGCHKGLGEKRAGLRRVDLGGDPVQQRGEAGRLVYGAVEKRKEQGRMAAADDSGLEAGRDHRPGGFVGPTEQKSAPLRCAFRAGARENGSAGAEDKHMLTKLVPIMGTRRSFLR